MNKVQEYNNLNRTAGKMDQIHDRVPSTNSEILKLSWARLKLSCWTRLKKRIQIVEILINHVSNQEFYSAPKSNVLLFIIDILNRASCRFHSHDFID